MKRFYLLLLSLSILSGQILPTVPSNVFRFSVGTNLSESDWKLEQQNFDLRGIGRHYFNNLQHNDSLRFSSNYDLYHNGTVLFDPNLEDAIPGSLSVENWMTKFNLEQNLSLPIFGTNDFDTSLTANLNGSFYQSQEKISTYQSINFEYGMSLSLIHI